MTDKAKDTKPEGDEKTTTPAEEKTTPSVPQDGKQIEDLQRTISSQGDQIKELQEAVVAASVISNTISSDPNLKANFDAALRKQYGGVSDDKPNQNSNPQGNDNNGKGTVSTTAQIEKDVTEIKETNRNKTIDDFERQTGIAGLPDDKRREARGKIETYLNSFGWSVKTIPLTNLRDSLDKAYVGTIGIERAKEEGKVEALTSYRSNEKGVMGSFSGANIQSEEGEELTSAQQKWLKNLNVDADKAKKFYKDRENEKVREKVIK